MKTWLAVESISNFNADKADEFRYLGISDRRVERAKKVKAGDLVFIYLPSPARAFAGIRLIERDGVGRSNHVMKYDIPCYTGIFTRPLISLESNDWLGLEFVRDLLTFGHQSAAGMRVSFREIGLNDAMAIVQAYKKNRPALNLTPATSLLR